MEVINHLRQSWNKLLLPLTDNEALIEKLWAEIVKKYNHKSRAYHSLVHIDCMLKELSIVESQINDPELLKLAIWYHDLIYSALRKDNELKSAQRAKAVLTQLHLQPERLDRAFHLIMLTKQHRLENPQDIDAAWMIDFDLEVLGRDWAAYLLYSQQIRKEYWMYPSLVYNKGRREALKHFLERDYIYQTNLYRNKHESAARQNIEREIELLK